MASPAVARALAELGYRSAHVGQKGEPDKGTDDGAVLEHASERNQVVVSNNNDLIVLAAQMGVPVIWIDPRGVTLTRLMLLWLIADQVQWWEQLLADGPCCVISRKGGAKSIPLEEAARLADGRIRRDARNKKRRRTYKAGNEPFPGVTD